MESAEVESDILRRVRTLLRELDGHHPACQCDRGMLRWTLHKKIDQNPSNSSVLVGILVKELERAERGDFRHYIIPLLHTLMYTLIKAPCISDELCSRVYDFCKKLLTLPKPFCTIGLDYAIKVKMERTAPGTLYQRMVISEQSLKSDPYPYQEKIFIFADPELLSEAICNALVTDTEAAQVSQSPRVCMCYVIIHAMQAALAEGCDVSGLKATLQDMPTSDVEHWFQQVVAAVECAGNEENADRNQHAARLEKIYCTILRSPQAGDVPLGETHGTPLPNPNISFHLWTEDDQLWKELVLFIRPLTQSCEPDCLSQDLDNFEIQDIISDCECCEQTRFSVLSTDSGIERDLPVAAEEPLTPFNAETEQSRLQRKGGIKKKPSPLESVAFLQAGCNGPGAKPPAKPPRRPGNPPEPMAPLQRLHTARIVLLGDDRILGRLTQAYHSLRKRETRRVFLTPRLNLQFYYIPVVTEQPDTPTAMDHVATGQEELCEVAGYLGRADPWYESNINTLCHMIPKLATMPSSPSKHLVTDLFITDVITYYVRMGIQPVSFQVYAVKIFFNDPAQEPAEDVFLTELRTQVQESISHKDLSTTKKKTTLDGPGIDLTATYRKVVLSDRAKELVISLRSTGLVMKSIPTNEAEDLAYLNVNITEIVKINNLSGRSFSTVTNRLKTRDIKIRSTEQRPFMVCLDKDGRRVYRNVISMEVSPCLEPSYCLQKTRTMKFSLHEAEDVGLVKYMPKCLLLPINTFSGVIQ
ncbi:phosphoinositide 3-kinase regulatory subunit 6 isoform X1 [Cuculus canorus]|uniref:phosphoinositide 3-kinase regulatory subunit 6 isoform X1 n=1 Tax=Cuculus canorus TaxID=55661 RepID=UPI00051B6F2A|nr:phosphoinositide 3-kinase regulatory subunit 6 isoform X1 [Cuculus canorus]XP_053939435.1 phosphoinositide 3-kinase regulatory subunit 6 isoform X1 [Cuculus canorus]XP_053939436.1 phosphoinositide 3-kinase regulatory subunit 6 isoform X1 [Cuculus canorus]XP_053939438.1 phosphoinositide 3-kinase regulatory subunit 6 isoform X1 [Cuculus canorus]XP_053939439.1 phosphoinositide 3-kinase regulatory subunit 6 isoform X1 [Cuculus canorus]